MTHSIWPLARRISVWIKHAYFRKRLLISVSRIPKRGKRTESCTSWPQTVLRDGCSEYNAKEIIDFQVKKKKKIYLVKWLDNLDQENTCLQEIDAINCEINLPVLVYWRMTTQAQQFFGRRLCVEWTAYKRCIDTLCLHVALLLDSIAGCYNLILFLIK